MFFFCFYFLKLIVIKSSFSVWQTSATGLERCGVAFLPVNPALSAPRNQGRQKLARLSAPELAALLRDVLLDATRRQRLATLQPRGFILLLLKNVSYVCLYTREQRFVMVYRSPSSHRLVFEVLCVEGQNLTLRFVL